ncbi:phosphatidylglycerol lysyltransferase domain-containing protein [Allorhizobium terrae]|uniref:Bifunctional lysylphosphatidylglycerol flippase/synthetase MprF n=1 Tax=Allorhizobium terrae TaxID=1848972 RepID=A0A4S3ZPQ3_9HYPH|nr:phosphatidylglycerol lysyltransferase domain-containing protein [Allorhizobium terrae]THF47499.1 bifunctional lysylphosphatidylglycerol flippase/synthetase MprF [Allorhizobium terrae]
MADVAGVQGVGDSISPARRLAGLMQRSGHHFDVGARYLLGAAALFWAALELAAEPLAQMGFAYRITHGLGQGGAIAFSVMAFASLGLSRMHRTIAQRPEGLVASGVSQTCLQKARDIVARQDDASADLVALGDKHILFSDCGHAFVMYGRRGRTWIVLFDPVGPKTLWPALVMKMVRKAKAAGCRVAFYQVSPAFLPTAADAGLRLFKLGDQAVVDLPEFDLKGGDWLKLRRSINRAERDGLEFSVLPPADVAAVMDELALVSDTWLAHHNAAEKGFSLGTFQRAYVVSHPVAIIRIEGRIVAFANILMTETRGSAFIDLMRHVPGVHRGAMDLLFVRIIQHLQAEGFQQLNLGMAPLSGLSARNCAPLWHHLGRFMFEHGERLYNFKGVQAFKAKFHPEWQPRYLAVADKRQAPAAMLDIALLIGGGVRGLLRR